MQLQNKISFCACFIAENPCKVVNCNYMCVLKDKDTACICQDGKPIMPNNICTADTPNNEVLFTSNKTYIRSEPVRHYSSTYSGLFIALVIIVLILSGFFYYQRNKLKKTSLDNLRYVPNSFHYRISLEIDF